MEREVEVTARVQWRDPLGRFAERIQEAADESAYDLAKRGAKLSRAYAPKKTRRLMKAIKAVKGLAGQARWTVEGDDKLLTIAASQEGGSVAHEIRSHDGGPLANKDAPGIGRVRKGGGRGKARKGFYAPSGVVRHPGTPALRFMERARLELAAVAVAVVRTKMPKRRA